MKASLRHNGLRSRYAYDAGGRLRNLLHHDNRSSRTLKRFRYEVDGRGNRTQVMEMAEAVSGVGETILSGDSRVDYFKGSWSTSGSFEVSPDSSAKLRLAFVGRQVQITLGNGSDHGICDIYIDQNFWGSLDTYSDSATDESVTIDCYTDMPHVLEIHNRHAKNTQSSGHKLSFKKVVTVSDYDIQTIQYAYDNVARLLAADYVTGTDLNGTASRTYAYTYDLAGNRTEEKINNGTPVNYTYNAANQISNTGFTYNANGNLTSDGANSYEWDRANRLLKMTVGSDDCHYLYNGLGQRVSQQLNTTTPITYLLDNQLSLAKIIRADDGTNVHHYLYGANGIHSQEDSGSWDHMIQDGLGSVRGVVDDALTQGYVAQYAPYGEILDGDGLRGVRSGSG